MAEKGRRVARFQANLRQEPGRWRVLKLVNRLGESEEDEGIHLSFTDLMALLLVFFILFFTLNKPLKEEDIKPFIINRVNGRIEASDFEKKQVDEKKTNLIKRFLVAAPAWADGLIADEQRQRQKVLAKINQSLLTTELKFGPQGKTDLERDLVFNEQRQKNEAWERIQHNLLKADQVVVPRGEMKSDSEAALALLTSDLKGNGSALIGAEKVKPTSTPSPQRERLRDKMERLKAAMPGFDLDVHSSMNSVVLMISDRVTFEEGRADIKPRFAQMLNRLAETIMNESGLVKIRIKGHTDAKPINNQIYPSNWELSGARAARVARFLIDRGLNPRLFEITGYSQYRPVVSNESTKQRALNRRVEIELLSG